MSKLLKTTEPYSELQILHMLVDDLFWEQDRMTSSGVEGLNKLANHVDQIQGLIMHDEYYKKYQEHLKAFDVPPWKKGK
mgnify:CR=1 FL=1|tara:strand:+ start:45 stop:281 length:237 start_codon:yes stop_codon:yes gene_type:complete